MELSTFLVVAIGATVLAAGGWGWFRWNRAFRQPAKIAKPKRKYTRKAKSPQPLPQEANRVNPAAAAASDPTPVASGWVNGESERLQ